MSIFLVTLLTSFLFLSCSSSSQNIHRFEIHELGTGISLQQDHVSYVEHGRVRRSADIDVKCREQENNFLQELKNGKVQLEQKHKFENESNLSMALAWCGNNGVILVVTTEEKWGEPSPSNIYRSENYGKTFEKINSKLPQPRIYKHAGVQRNPHDSNKIYMVDGGTKSGSRLFVTTDGGKMWNTYQLSFRLTGDILFHPDEKYNTYLLASSSMFNTKTLYASFNNGQSWQLVDNYVESYRWGSIEEKNPKLIYTTLDPQRRNPLLAAFMQINHHLYKYPEGTLDSKTKILDKVVTFGHQGKFLYASVYVNADKGNRLMKVSTNQGKTWNEAQLATLTGDRFFSVLDMSEHLVFMHVDNPGDTGHGTLYTSDSSGVVYSESLTRHLYPNYGDVTDFVPIASMRGVYLTSQMSIDDSIHTMITYNRGATWQQLPRPEGAPCKDEKKPCHLQIHGAYSLKRGILASTPLSVESAPGIILVHGHVADALQTTKPDVYITSDGGYKWRFALKGPHHYQIAASGSLIVAVPADESTPRILKFSTDEGRCWHEYSFIKNTSEPITFTGLLTEPGSKSLVVSIWGYYKSDRKWATFVVEFKKVLTKECTVSDYETWMPHETMRKNENKNVEGCLLGTQEIFKRVKKDSWCYNDYDYVIEKKQSTCQCTREDYECEYGFYRPANSDKCSKIKDFKRPEIDICLRGHEEKIVTEGYRKIPGDECTGGFVASGNMIDMDKRCSDSDRTLIIKEEMSQPDIGSPNSGKVLLAVVITGIVIIVVIMGVFFIHKYIILRRHRVVYRYSLLNQNQDPDDDVEDRLASQSVVYQESSDDEELNSPAVRKETANGFTKTKPKSTLQSYHDDSDVDMLE